MSYTLVVSKEQEKLTDICDAITCFGKHLRVTQPDSMGKVQPYLAEVCRACNQATRCRVLKQLVDCWLNNGCCSVES